MNRYYHLMWIWSLLLLTACLSQKARNHKLPNPVDTKSRPIELQQKKTYAFSSAGIYADNQFDGARLNDFSQINDSTFQARISPENEPINPSPWYAFRLWADQAKSITLQLAYDGAQHRYPPKISMDNREWTEIDSAAIQYNEDSTQVHFTLSLSADTLWLAGQEIISSGRVKEWSMEQAKHAAVRFSSIGSSKLGRDIPHLDMYSGSPEGKEIIVVLSRQHPPEVTGYMAMQAFVEEILQGPQSAAFVEQYRVLVYPLMNPDGVDLGHWRHNAGGIDLNRDWAYYHQPETREVADHIVRTAKEAKAKVILGLDFHSTYHDVYYTFDHTQLKTDLIWFNEAWFEALEANLPGYEVNERPSGLTRPISKNWFYLQLKAESTTYEIGDDTPRDFIHEKGTQSARQMMRLLLEHQNQ